MRRLLGGFEHGLGKRKPAREGKPRRVYIIPGLARVIEVLGVHKDHARKVMGLEIAAHAVIGKTRHHRVVLLAKAVPDERWQEIGGAGVARMEVLDGA